MPRLLRKDPEEQAPLGPLRGRAHTEAVAHLPLWQTPVTYTAVGATQSEAILRYPPLGFRSMQRTVRIGHGEARWDYAWLETLSWGIQRRSGMTVTQLDTPVQVTEATYLPVSFDTQGIPVAPATLGEDAEQVFAPDGRPLVHSGETVLLHVAPWPRDIPARVVWVVDERNRRGFAYGTLPGHPECGEEAFIVERRADDSVWLTIRSFSRPANRWWWAVYPALRLVQWAMNTRYEKALTGKI